MGVPSFLFSILVLSFRLRSADGFGMSCCLPATTPTFPPHLEKTIKNPFPGIPALEAAIGRKIVDRIGSNEGIPVQDHPLAGQYLLLDIEYLNPKNYFEN